MFEVQLHHVRKSFGTFEAIRDLTLTFPAGTTTCLLGPSGCGKTTIIRMVAGLENPTSGEIRFNGKVVNALPPRRRDLAMVFQYPVVYRGLSVYEKIELPLREQKLAPQERRERVEQAIALLGLEKNLRDRPERFDNGVRQRVAFARAVARRSSLLLFDEPITNVDHESRLQLKQDLKKLTATLRQTILYVTHDQNEAMTLADQIVLLKNGEVVQQGTPRELYGRPAQTFGGWFLGSPGMNFLEHAAPAPAGSAGPGQRQVASDLFNFAVAWDGAEALDQAGTGKFVFGIRPELVRVHPHPTPQTVPGRVRRKFRGVLGQFLVNIQLAGHELKAKVSPQLGPRLGEHVWVECRPEDVAVFTTGGNRLEGKLVRATGPTDVSGVATSQGGPDSV